MQRLALSVLVIVTMCGIGLRTSTRDFAEVWKRPVPLSLALLANVVGVPLLATWFVSMLHLPAAVTVGLLLVSASPGGSVGPLFAMLAGGHGATAVTSLVVLSVISVFTMPAMLSGVLGFSAAIDVRVGSEPQDRR